MEPLISLHDPRGRDQDMVGAKFSRLAAVTATAALLDLAQIPDAVCVPAAEFTGALGSERLEALIALFHRVTATAGSELMHLDTDLTAIIDALALPSSLWPALAARCTGSGAWAVRSSSLVEDGDRYSQAGLYESYLHLEGLAEIAAAVIGCWKSFYHPRAVLARMRIGDTDPGPRMAVIVQRMVDADLAGVAFTQTGNASTGAPGADHQRPSASTVVCAAVGTSEHLVAGITDAARYDIKDPACSPPPYDRVASLATGLREHLGHDVDIEWAWSQPEGLQLLQVRPVTAALTAANRSDRPVFAATSLYFTDRLPEGVTLGACAEVFLAVTTKRSQIFRQAVRSGITVDDGWLVTLNGAGLATPTAWPPWWDGLDGEVIVDLGPTARQNIMPARDLAKFLATALNLDSQPHTTHSLLLRPFHRGTAGAVTRPEADGTTTLEHSPDGLLAINRGLTSPDRLRLPPPSDQAGWAALTVPAPWHRDALRQMAAFSHTLAALFPTTFLEWVLDGPTPHFLDYSTTTRPTVTTSGPGGTISPGTESGPLLVLDSHQDLARLSIAPIVSISGTAPVPESRYITDLMDRIAELPAPPVIYADRPYVILARLIGRVAGFVFAGGSELCHLAILLRESRTPSIVASLPPGTGDGHMAVIDRGRLHVTLPA